MTLEPIHRLQAFLNAIRRAFVQHSTQFQLTRVLARFLCVSRFSCGIGAWLHYIRWSGYLPQPVVLQPSSINGETIEVVNDMERLTYPLTQCAKCLVVLLLLMYVCISIVDEINKASTDDGSSGKFCVRTLWLFVSSVQAWISWERRSYCYYSAC